MEIQLYYRYESGTNFAFIICKINEAKIREQQNNSTIMSVYFPKNNGY